MNVIFLDIDGVLNNMNHVKWLHENVQPGLGFGHLGELAKGNITKDTVGWDTDNVNALYHIVFEGEAQIVISSTWRKLHSLSAIQSYFKPFGDIPPIIGATPSVNKIGSKRGDEVNAWLEDNPEVNHWVCLDDDSDYYPENNLIHVDNQVGLTMNHVQPAVDILTGYAQ